MTTIVFFILKITSGLKIYTETRTPVVRYGREQGEGLSTQAVRHGVGGSAARMLSLSSGVGWGIGIRTIMIQMINNQRELAAV